MQVFQKVVAVQQKALSGEDRRHLLGNPRGSIAHCVDPGVVAIPAPQGQGEHLLPSTLGRAHRRRVTPPRALTRHGHQAEPYLPPVGPPKALGASPRTGATRWIQRQLPSAHHAPIALHDQPRFSRPVAALPLIVGQGFPLLPSHEAGGPLSLGKTTARVLLGRSSTP